MLMMPPTYSTCAELFDHPDTASALAAADSRDLTPVRPKAVREGDEVYLSIPRRLAELSRDVSARSRG
jgi:hypothetical protein